MLRQLVVQLQWSVCEILPRISHAYIGMAATTVNGTFELSCIHLH